MCVKYMIIKVSMYFLIMITFFEMESMVSYANSQGDNSIQISSDRSCLKRISENERKQRNSVNIRGNIQDGENLTINIKNNLRKENDYDFSCSVDKFETLLIGHGRNEIYNSYIEITPVCVKVHNYTDKDHVVIYSHGLNISELLRCHIKVKSDGTCSINIMSKKGSCSIEDANWNGCGAGAVFAQSIGSVLLDCSLSWSSSDLLQPIWIFGDSYITHTDSARWPYYLAEDGYLDNVLLNGYGGQNSQDAIQTLEDMLKRFDPPKYLVWLLGMNDGSDNGYSIPSDRWLSSVNELIRLCETYEIIPVLSTVPTVPSINHEAKNLYVRKSGYRYIDMERAVSTLSFGQWKEGMLGGDLVHPTKLGAQALYKQILHDFPEINGHLGD